MGQQAQAAFTSLMRPFPPGTPFGVRLAAVGFKQSPISEAVTVPVRPSGVVPASPEQRYLPGPESACNSRGDLNAARGPRTSPAKRVVWGEDEQRSERGLPQAAG